MMTLTFGGIIYEETRGRSVLVTQKCTFWLQKKCPLRTVLSKTICYFAVTWNFYLAALEFHRRGHHWHATLVKLKERVSPTPTRGHEATLEALHPRWSLD
jgi:hypothetical protein